jgi:Ca2+:H+ antiporter
MTVGLVLRVLPLALVPVSLMLGRLDAPPALIFLVAAAAIVPLADWIRKGTEQVAPLPVRPSVGCSTSPWATPRN